jgi:glycerol kinase
MAKLAALGYSAADVKAVGITNQRETTLVWDRITGVPLYNAIGEPSLSLSLCV